MQLNTKKILGDKIQVPFIITNIKLFANDTIITSEDFTSS